MERVLQKIDTTAIKISLVEEEKEIGRVFLYIVKNALHASPYGLMEDLFVIESGRGRGLGKELVRLVVDEARKFGCYKLICTSRDGKEKVHKLYRKLGFYEHGKEFRMQLKNPD
jgi:GNAT superfamily N-acetyltransferase